MSLTTTRILPLSLCRYFLENTHRVTVELYPDPAMSERTEAEEAQRLAAIKEGMTEAELEAVMRTQEALQEKQATPDTPEALKCIPTLQLSDIPTENTPVPTEMEEVPPPKSPQTPRRAPPTGTTQ